MIAKEKAKELIDKYSICITTHKGTSIIGKEMAKQCALICIDEIFKLNIIWYDKDFADKYKEIKPEMTLEFWEEAKQEIEKL